LASGLISGMIFGLVGASIMSPGMMRKSTRSPSEIEFRRLQDEAQGPSGEPKKRVWTAFENKVASDGARNYLFAAFQSFLGPPWDPKIDQKTTRSGKSAPQDGAGSGCHRFLAPPPFEVAFQVDFGRV